MIHLTAPAKINVNLKILGKRNDGYHELISLVGFADFGDKLRFRNASEDKLVLDGQHMKMLQHDAADNLVIKARDGLRALGLDIPPTEIHLEKHIPIGGGLGGGSSDAATTIRGLINLYDLTVSDDALHKLALSLGADVPACLVPGWKVMSGIGETIIPLDGDTYMPNGRNGLPYITLANPGVHVSTASIFSDLNADTKSLQTLQAESANTNQDILACWEAQDWSSSIDIGNDLTLPATTNCAPISDLLEEMSRLADKQSIYGKAMSGSGSSCFALFSEEAAATSLSDKLRAAGYWAISAPMVENRP